MQVTAAEILHALDQGEFRFFYQPKVSFLTGQVSGAEALIRWQRDERTIVPPDAFIPVALAHGLVPEITQSMFPRLVEDFQRIRGVNAATTVALNVTAQDLDTPRLLALVRAAVAGGAISSSQLEIEITESETVSGSEMTTRCLHALIGEGVQLSMDDYGTGYSSLDSLNRLPFDAIKMDQSFVLRMLSSPKSATLVKASVAMAEFARELVHSLRDAIGGDLAAALLASRQHDEAEIAAQRARVAELKATLQAAMAKNGTDYRYGQLLAVADYLVKKSVWGVGGDGWAFDIGYGGLDHVLASQRNINLLVLNTQMYSNTGGQMSKATPMGSVALFAAGGKTIGKKDLGSIAMTYGNIYVAQVAMGYSDSQTVRAFVEAESYDGPSLIIAYSHCISMGFDMSRGYEHQKMAVQSGSWICYRFDPRLASQGRNPLQIDSKEMSLPVDDFVPTENRYNMLKKAHPEAAEMLWDKAQKHVCTRWQILKQQAEMVYSEACPFEPGVVDEEALAATGARDVTMESSGVNLPAGRDMEDSSGNGES